MQNIIIDACKVYLNYECPDPQEIFYVDFFQKSLEIEKRVYSYCNEEDKIESAINDIMKMESSVNLVLFRDAFIHIVRITRLLRMHKGHLIIIGQAGSGKKSLV